MNPSAESFQKIVDNDLQPEVFSLRMLRKIDTFCRQNDKMLKVHLKLDTGMHRLGLNVEDLAEALDLLKNNSYLQVQGVFTHLASAEDAEHDDFTLNQVALFDSAFKQISSTLGTRPMRHVLNSSGIIRHSSFQYEMVRLGIGLYGYDPAGLISSDLLPASRLTTIISQIRTISVGETVGYGRIGKADSTMTVATLAIGYADGFGRNLGNGNCRLWINESWAPTIGNVCMDMTMVDITGINANEGDEIEIFGAHQSIAEFAAAAQTIPYEILTSVAERVKRIYKYSS